MYVEVMDEEWLYSEEQVRSLLEWMRGHAGAHRSVHPFMRIVAEQALRPGEARALRVSDVVLPEGDLGKLTARHKGVAREIPLQPQAVEFLRGWISDAGLQEDDLLFPGMGGGALSPSVYKWVWEQAQQAVLSRDELYSWRLGEPISILRESCLVKWLRMGISSFAVAEWAGVTPNWLGLRYQHCFRTEKVEIDWDRLAEATALPDLPRS
ncbi:tyrosine-type recombinase/integrase [Streptomyces scabiei]|uniref:tyrosine-type recombinase/integrase n=1 Tax=Streptomyces scabiei TaxID=1930 RepID=UPI001B314889|nr:MULTISPECIES: tyrosine-type recombinase/integrase [Streptomyces]MBP5860690.1 tyrosine-type recombinase/integrase [Streptomyces sp. LBUM 1484]MBP5879047.1 tyrosine-type recombinase/integrase [Streptomyces sp. LBUM 1477]MBP5886739.1 tyrosine-type recombinase/integrase [Streptomyces sp. LBUM 1487]MBP5902735.1 tyrosine-type recombinase/integrase [Streptomyces sp. LBUM 1488]MDW8476484.1 tyrosine-type recombinase/integrase [Streptomyces scabiei]